VVHINQSGAYNPRPQEVSNTLSRELVRDLFNSCKAFREDVLSGVVSYRTNCTLTVGKMHQSVDLVVGIGGTPPNKRKEERKENLLLDGVRSERGVVDWGEPKEVRMIVENKSLMTAHRNVYNRSRPLRELADYMFQCNPAAIHFGTWMIGTALKYVNPDRVKWAEDTLRVLCQKQIHQEFPFREIRKLLGTGDKRLSNFLLLDGVGDLLFSYNKPEEAAKTLDKIIANIEFRDDESTRGFDAFAIQLIYADNVGPVRLDEPEFFKQSKYDRVRYQRSLSDISRIYERRFS
jgi:hypothetical protein